MFFMYRQYILCVFAVNINYTLDENTHPMCGILFNIVNRDISTNGDNDSIPAFPPGHVFKCDHYDHCIQKQNLSVKYNIIPRS